MKTILSETPLVYTVDDLFTEKECQSILQLIDPIDFKVAPITLCSGEFLLDEDYRNNTRIILDSDELSSTLYTKLFNHLPTSHKGWHICGLNERFRFYRYATEQKFEKHFDGRYRKSIDVESRYTLLLYLTDQCTGGATAFFDADDGSLRFEVKPKAGQVVIFDHHQLHSGEPVTSGIKTVIRTDIMYSRY